MHSFGDTVVMPLLRALSPKTVVEVGAATGLMTQQLLPWAAETGARVRVVDPKPLFSVSEYAERFGSTFEIHEAMSHDVLPHCADAGAILLDGDHNWYTVYNELRIIDDLRPAWPLVLMHDVNWPYARRDQYYVPENVPTEFRQPHRPGGIVRNRSGLANGEGKNPRGIHATHEGGERNGVVTALEDFIGQTRRELLFCVVRGPGGLGIVVEPSMLEREPGVVAVLRENHDPAFTAAISPKYGTRELPGE